ncbi:MAG TPA: NAD(P)/FAD-dependent oxidoreductase [Candidatus Binatia bacterium]|nr:NAD(P)/FAD-dependent oxidoreductase [Candidatus Binatia bacterium]
MIPEASEARPRVVVVGAGFGGLAAARSLRRAGVSATLVDRHNYHLFQPLLYQVASALLDPSDVAHPVRAILRRWPGFDFRLADVEGVDIEGHRLLTSTGDIGFDHLVLATGSANSYFGNQAVADRAYGLKDLGEALALRARVLEVFEAASRTESAEQRRSLLTFVVVGAGPTGVEYAGALSELVGHVLRRDFPRLDVSLVRIVLVEATKQVLGAFPPGLGRRAAAALRRKGVLVLLDHAVAGMTGSEVRFADGSRIAAATMVWTAGVAAERLAGADPFERAAQGRIPVRRDTLEVIGHPGIHAIGDLAACPGEDGKPLPMLAPVAIQQGHHVGRVITARLRGKPEPGPFTYRDKGTMATVGRNVAVAQVGPLRLGGFIGWLTWLFVHLMYLVSFRSRLLVLIGWAWNYVFYDRPVRLIAAPTPPRHGGRLLSGTPTASVVGRSARRTRSSRHDETATDR